MVGGKTPSPRAWKSGNVWRKKDSCSGSYNTAPSVALIASSDLIFTTLIFGGGEGMVHEVDLRRLRKH
jgi:hypothetical protein